MFASTEKVFYSDVFYGKTGCSLCNTEQAIVYSRTALVSMRSVGLRVQ